MPHPKDAVKLKEWCDALDRDYPVNRDAWNRYDSIIMNTVSDYNMWLKGKAGFPGLDWMKIKAQAWVETGANDPAWNGNVLQIGKIDDPGLNDYLTKPAARLFMLPQYKPFLNASIVKHDPTQSIRAGVGYLLYRAAYFGLVEIPVPDSDPMPGWPAGTAPQFRSNMPLIPRRKTHKALGITSWRPLNLHTIAARYNAGGDGNYYDKLVHAYDVTVRNVPQSSGASK